MKKAIALLSALCIIILLVVASCKKNTGTSTYEGSHINELFSWLRSTPQNFNITAGRDTVIFAADTTVIHFYPNSFRDASGTTITNAIINIDLIEIYKSKEMVQNRAPTVATDGSLLQSGGEIKISATMNGQKVLANSYSISFKQPHASAQPMQLYFGDTNNPDSSVTWDIDYGSSPVLRTSDTLSYNGGTFKLFDFYVFDSCHQFGWINCDFSTSPSPFLTNFHVVVPDGTFNLSNTIVYVILPSATGVNFMMQAANYSEKSHSFLLGTHSENAAIGSKMKVVAITVTNSGCFYYETSTTITSNEMTINASMAPETRGDIIARLAGL